MGIASQIAVILIGKLPGIEVSGLQKSGDSFVTDLFKTVRATSASWEKRDGYSLRQSSTDFTLSPA